MLFISQERRNLKKPKLRVFVQFKNDFHTESHIKINLSSKVKSYLSQLRLGTFRIAIETRRYRHVPISEKKMYNMSEK